MSELERIIAERDRLNRIIDEYCTTEEAGVISIPNNCGLGNHKSFGMETGSITNTIIFGSTNITIDNSTNSYSHREVNTNTTLAGGDSALGMLGGLIEKLF